MNQSSWRLTPQPEKLWLLSECSLNHKASIFTIDMCTSACIVAWENPLSF